MMATNFKSTVEYYHLLSNKSFEFTTFTGAGTPARSAWHVLLPITDDMGRDSAGIFNAAFDAATIQAAMDSPSRACDPKERPRANFN